MHWTEPVRATAEMRTVGSSASEKAAVVVHVSAEPQYHVHLGYDEQCEREDGDRERGDVLVALEHVLECFCFQLAVVLPINTTAVLQRARAVTVVTVAVSRGCKRAGPDPEPKPF